MNTQLCHIESQEIPVSPRLLNQQKIIVILAACMALQMTGYVMILPLFARRFSEFGAGVELLGTSVTAWALTSTLAAPFMGALADRFGRRLLVLGSLAFYVLAFVGYLFASSALEFILLRALAGAFTAGLVPAILGIVADLAPAARRAQWIGIVNGGASFGWIAGPILGGLFYDRWGYQVAVSISILLALATLLTALLIIPETRNVPNRSLKIVVHNPEKPNAQPDRQRNLNSAWSAIRATLPLSLPAFIALLGISFAVMFAWAFIEPSFMFYAYDGLGWNSSMLGLVMSTYGIALMLGEFGLSPLSDRFGRKPMIVLGVILFAAQFIGLAFFRNYVWISVTFIIAGLGNALYDPAISASILDITSTEHQARVQGIRSMAGSLGTILGPALAVLLTPYLNAQAIFLAAIVVVIIAIGIGLSVPLKLTSKSDITSTLKL